MIVACAALLVALGGTSYAAIKLAPNSVGTAQLKNGAVTFRKVKAHSLRASNFASGQLPAGPTGPAGPAGPQGPAGPAGGGASLKWALVRADGGIAAQSGGITLAAKPGTGTYLLNFGSAVSGHPILASGAYANDGSDQRGATTAGPCGGGAEGRTCSSSDNTSTVFVQTRSDAGIPADHAFYVAVG
jgi:hypothetical protein